jgi:hypothetical protein
MNETEKPSDVVDADVSTSKWLRELGAIRPMAPTGLETLVLGEHSEGIYPIEWVSYIDNFTRDFNGKRMHKEPIERWRIFGFLTHEKVTREDCERILRAIGQSRN